MVLGVRYLALTSSHQELLVTRGTPLRLRLKPSHELVRRQTRNRVCDEHAE